MNRNRKSRLNLSLVQRSESPKSPNRTILPGNETRSIDRSSECNTTPNTRKRSSLPNDGSPTLHDYDQSPLPLSQDTSNVVTGVSWAWNSPKRAIVLSEIRQRSKPLSVHNNIIKVPEFPRIERKNPVQRLTGFYKFQSELKLLQESESRLAADEQHSVARNNSSMIVCLPGSSQSSENESIPASCFETETEQLEPADSRSSLKVHPPNSPKSELKDCSISCPNTATTNPGDNNTLVKRGLPSNIDMQSDFFNDSVLDGLLMQASQAAEKTSDETNESSSVETISSSDIAPQRKSFFKSRTVDLDGTTSDSLDDSDLDLFLIEASKMMENTVKVPEVQKQYDSNASKKFSGLSRHKSMPVSPRPNNNVAFPVHTEASSTQQKGVSQASRLCSKEEIEQKRQEALKRQQARRLNRLMACSAQNNTPKVLDRTGNL